MTDNQIKSDQWIGFSKSDDEFQTIMLDLDESETHCEGTFYLFPKSAERPSYFGRVVTADRGPIQSIDIALSPFSPGFGKDAKSNDAPLQRVSLNLLFADESLSVGLNGDVGFDSPIKLRSHSASNYDRPDLGVEALSWSEFKCLVETFPYKDFVFRGQPEAWPITTSFHRTNRKDLIKYIEEDIPLMRRELYPYIDQSFDSHGVDENAAMLHLLQHHGYPTPMIDWSNSAYISAFFAFSSLTPAQEKNDGSVRIFIFDRSLWAKHSQPTKRLTYSRPHISFADVVPIKNTRSIPQQGVSMFTNCFAVEDFVAHVSNQTGQTFLRAIDIPVSEKSHVIEDLRKMGISPASLFPGMDGVCQNVSEMRFLRR